MVGSKRGAYLLSSATNSLLWKSNTGRKMFTANHLSIFKLKESVAVS